MKPACSISSCVKGLKGIPILHKLARFPFDELLYCSLCYVFHLSVILQFSLLYQQGSCL
jgi:hypothetical protein